MYNCLLTGSAARMIPGLVQVLGYVVWDSKAKVEVMSHNSGIRFYLKDRDV